jgi:hypothetical protein
MLTRQAKAALTAYSLVLAVARSRTGSERQLFLASRRSDCISRRCLSYKYVAYDAEFAILPVLYGMMPFMLTRRAKAALSAYSLVLALARSRTGSELRSSYYEAGLRARQLDAH